MLKDINNTPESLNKLFKTYMQDNNKIKLPVDPITIEKIYIIASGSSRNAANTAKYFIEKATNIPVIVDFAGEFANRTPSISQNDLVIALSQSGKTSDVLAALKKVKELQIPVFSITNNEDSEIHRLADSAMFIHAGAEESIPATKSFICQLMSLYLLGLYLAEKRISLSLNQINSIKSRLLEVPDNISLKIEDFRAKVSAASSRINDFNNLIILGRGQNSILAEEEALKIQETSYINAVSYPTGEFMHGHIAVLDENFPIISITETFDSFQNCNLAINNTKEIKDKRNPILIIIGHDRDDIKDLADIFIGIEEQDEIITPFLTIVVLQLLAYTIAEQLGIDTTRPRGLNKTVLSE